MTLTYGSATDLPITGDWIAQAHDGVGMFRPSNGYVYLKNALTTGFANTSFFYGQAGDAPVAGHWQANYPPVALLGSPTHHTVPPTILLTKTPTAPSNGNVVPGDGHLGD